MQSNCIYNERVSENACVLLLPEFQAIVVDHKPLLSSAFNLGGVVLNFRSLKELSAEGACRHSISPVAVTISLSLAAYLCQGSRGFLAILIPSFHGLRQERLVQNSNLLLFFTMCFLAAFALALALVLELYGQQFNTVNELTCYLKASRFKFFFTWDHESPFDAHT